MKKRTACREEQREHYAKCPVCIEALKTIAAFASLCETGRRLHTRGLSLTAMMREGCTHRSLASSLSASARPARARWRCSPTLPKRCSISCLTVGCEVPAEGSLLAR